MDISDLEKSQSQIPFDEYMKIKNELDMQRAKNVLQNRTVKFWQKENEKTNSELEVALAIKEKVKKFEIKQERSSGRSESTAVLLASDWHAEETVDPEVVNNKNEFNLEICENRIINLFNSTLKLTNMWRAGTKVDNFVLALLGDLMTGYIHDELIESNQLSPVQVILWLQQRIIAGIKLLLQKGDFKRIDIPCCFGNHSRTGKEYKISTAYKNNYEWLLYNQLSLLFKNEKRVNFYITKGYFQDAQIYKYKIRFHHGNYIRYAGGVGGITIPVNKAIDAWNKNESVDYTFFGHYHQTIDHRFWNCNGSLIGYNAFALSIKARFEKPSQTLLFIEKDKGKTATIPIYV